MKGYTCLLVGELFTDDQREKRAITDKFSSHVERITGVPFGCSKSHHHWSEKFEGIKTTFRHNNYVVTQSGSVLRLWIKDGT